MADDLPYDPLKLLVNERNIFAFGSALGYVCAFMFDVGRSSYFAVGREFAQATTLGIVAMGSALFAAANLVILVTAPVPPPTIKPIWWVPLLSSLALLDFGMFVWAFISDLGGRYLPMKVFMGVFVVNVLFRFSGVRKRVPRFVRTEKSLTERQRMVIVGLNMALLAIAAVTAADSLGRYLSERKENFIAVKDTETWILVHNGPGDVRIALPLMQNSEPPTLDANRQRWFTKETLAGAKVTYINLPNVKPSFDNRPRGRLDLSTPNSIATKVSGLP
jgi:hypothetical protein